MPSFFKCLFAAKRLSGVPSFFNGPAFVTGLTDFVFTALLFVLVDKVAGFVFGLPTSAFF